MIKCIAIDDEPLALELMEDNIKQVPFLNLVKSCKNAFEAIEVLQNEQIDLLFLDIQMPGITGIQFLQSLPAKPMVIFVTAYKEYALDGFNLDVLDYLLKPVSFNRFLKAATKALEYHNSISKQQHTLPVTDDYIFVNSEYNMVKVVLNDIIYIEGLKDYVKIHLNNSPRPVITRLSMKFIEEKLSPEKYIRVHKSFIIAMDKITSIRKKRILFGDKEVPIGDSYYDSFYKAIEYKNVL